MTVVFRKGENFDSNINNEDDRKGLERLAEGKFANLSILRNEIRRFNAYVSADLATIKSFINLSITELPFVLNVLPVIYSDRNPKAHPYSDYYIGNVEVVD